LLPYRSTPFLLAAKGSLIYMFGYFIFVYLKIFSYLNEQ